MDCLNHFGPFKPETQQWPIITSVLELIELALKSIPINSQVGMEESLRNSLGISTEALM
jgi:hypothetical protein